MWHRKSFVTGWQDADNHRVSLPWVPTQWGAADVTARESFIDVAGKVGGHEVFQRSRQLFSGAQIMIISVASGKGGTGKTTVAVSLALSLSDDGGFGTPLLVDCDVEAPNAGLFLHPTFEEHRDVVQPIPVVDPRACDLCKRCAEVCAFNAIAVVGERVLVFPEMCHGCGSCALNCPTGAIKEKQDVKGMLERGRAVSVDFAHGVLNVGVAMPVPAIRQLKQWTMPTRSANSRPIIVDAPPGTSCPVVETVRDTDFVLLVTEPTPFGLHDLHMAIEVARDELGLPVGVVVNRDGIGDRAVDDYCATERIPLLMRIPHDRRIAEAYSEGVPLIKAIPEYRDEFRNLYTRIESLVNEMEVVK
jgi:MinD superfamily P-loop ATPase